MARGAPGGAGRRALHPWTQSPDLRSVGVLVVVPAVLLVVPAVLGHPAITGDNLIQNFPLRVLTGVQLRQGHLPLWNPYLWGGSPLLGGLNSGSFYPFTFLFVVLAPVGAFVANLLVVYWAGGLGLYALARQYRVRPWAALLGALTYMLSGTMVGQIVHLGVVQGMSLAPLLVLAELRLSWAVLGTGPVRAGAPDAAAPCPAAVGVEAPRRRWRGGGPWPWVALLAAVVGLEALTGEPRAMAETEVLGTAVALWLVLRPYRHRVGIGRRARFVGCSFLAGVWGVALAAAELAPGWAFIQASQRATESYQFFGSGSLRVRWSFLLLVPDLFGGSGHFGQPTYFNRYNLAEVTGYVGLLPVAAALVLASRSFGRRRSAMSSDWGMWLALVVFGLFLAWGTFTPLGHLWAAIPLYGKTRLQSRSLGIVDLALAVLLAFWAERLAGRQAGEGTAGWRRLLAVAPALAAVGTCAAALAAPAAVEGWFDVTAGGATLARQLWPWFLAQAVVAAGVVAVVVLWGRMGDRRRRGLLTAVVVCNLAFFVLAVSTANPAPGSTLEPTRAEAAAVLGTTGRFAISDTVVSHVTQLTQIGQPDLNAFTRLPSVQGYGSILSEQYGAATGTHTLDTMDPCALATGVFNQLRLSTMLIFPSNLAPGLRADHAAPAPPAACPGAPLPGTARRRVLYLGWTTTLVAATVVTTTPVPAGTRLRVGVLGPNGGTRWPDEVVQPTAGGWAVRFDRPTPAAGLVIDGPARAISDTSTVTGPRGNGWAFDGRFQNAVGVDGWRFTGTWDGTFGRFARTGVRPPVWLSHAAAGSSVRQLRTSDWGATVDRVIATRTTTVVWSEAYLPGWHAELAGLGGSRRGGGPLRLPVSEHGLVQSVRVPRGRWILTFVYRAPHLTLGLVGSFVGVAGFVALGALTLLDRRRRSTGRHRKGGRGPDPTGSAGVPARRAGDRVGAFGAGAGAGAGEGPPDRPRAPSMPALPHDGGTGPPVPRPLA